MNDLGSAMRNALLLLVIGLLLWERPSHANGDSYFDVAPDGEDVDLVYFGQIKDTNGVWLTGVDIIFRVTNLALTLPVQNDRPGHYRSPDIGKLLKEYGERVDPSQITFECVKAGYRQIKNYRSVIPNRTKGIYEVNCVFEPITEGN